MDDGEDILIHIMRILVSDLPDALTVDLIKEAAALDPTYQKLVVAIRQGHYHMYGRYRVVIGIWRVGQISPYHEIQLLTARLGGEGGEDMSNSIAVRSPYWTFCQGYGGLLYCERSLMLP